MTLESYLPRLIGYAKFLSRDNYEDLVQDTVVRLLANQHKYTLSEALLTTICKNIWKDNLRKSKEIVLEHYGELCDTVLIFMPEVEVSIYCKETSINLYDWKCIDLKKAKDRERKYKAYHKKKELKCSLQSS